MKIEKDTAVTLMIKVADATGKLYPGMTGSDQLHLADRKSVV